MKEMDSVLRLCGIGPTSGTCAALDWPALCGFWPPPSRSLGRRGRLTPLPAAFPVTAPGEPPAESSLHLTLCYAAELPVAFYRSVNNLHHVGPGEGRFFETSKHVELFRQIVDHDGVHDPPANLVDLGASKIAEIQSQILVWIIPYQTDRFLHQCIKKIKNKPKKTDATKCVTKRITIQVVFQQDICLNEKHANALQVILYILELK